jgi:hypothetical protein
MSTIDRDVVGPVDEESEPDLVGDSPRKIVDI